jgi:hypothetical protein
MHFSKVYAQILLTLPPDLRQHAISYRQVSVLQINVFSMLIDEAA